MSTEIARPAATGDDRPPKLALITERSVNPSWTELKEKWSRKGPRATLARGASGALVANVIGAGLGYLMHVFLARAMGEQHYGVLAYVISWLAVLQFIGMFGLPQTVVRFGAAYQARGELGPLRGLLRWSNGVALAVSCAVGVAMAAIAAALPESVLADITEDPRELRLAFYVGALALPVIVYKMVKVQTLRAFGGAVYSIVLERVYRPAALIVLTALALLVFGSPLGGVLGTGLYLVAFAGVAVLAVVMLRRREPAGLREAAPAYERREWMAMALPSVFIAGMGVLLNAIDRVMIGAMIGTDEAGIYNAATRTAQLVTFGLVAVNAVLGPMVAGMHATGDKRQLQRVLTLAAWALFGWTLLGSLGLLIFGRWVLWMFGPAFVVGYLPLAVMVLAQVVNSSCGSAGLLLNMTGHQKKVAQVLAVSAVINVVLNVSLIPPFGMNGAALATGISMAIWNVIMLVVVRQTLHLNPTIFKIPRWLKR